MKKKIKDAIDREVHLESAIDGFFGRVRRCKFCKTPTEFDFKTGERFCPKGCFKGKIKRKEEEVIERNKRRIAKKICSKCGRNLKARTKSRVHKLFVTPIGKMCGRCKCTYWKQRRRDIMKGDTNERCKNVR